MCYILLIYMRCKYLHFQIRCPKFLNVDYQCKTMHALVADQCNISVYYMHFKLATSTVKLKCTDLHIRIIWRTGQTRFYSGALYRRMVNKFSFYKHSAYQQYVAKYIKYRCVLLITSPSE